MGAESKENGAFTAEYFKNINPSKLITPLVFVLIGLTALLIGIRKAKKKREIGAKSNIQVDWNDTTIPDEDVSHTYQIIIWHTEGDPDEGDEN